MHENLSFRFYPRILFCEFSLQFYLFAHLRFTIPNFYGKILRKDIQKRLIFTKAGYPHPEVMVLDKKTSISLKAFGIGMLLGGAAAAVLLLSVYWFVILPFAAW